MLQVCQRHWPPAGCGRLAGGIAKPVIPSTLCIWKDGLVADVEGREYPAEAAEGERHRE